MPAAVRPGAGLRALRPGDGIAANDKKGGGAMKGALPVQPAAGRTNCLIYVIT